MKNVLILYYSQSGDVDGVIRSFAQPLLDSPEIAVHWERIETVEPYRFPWPIYKFFDT
jgi:hypothetical protein